MKSLFFALILMAGFVCSVNFAYAANQSLVGLKSTGDLFSNVLQSDAIHYCEKNCTDRADCAAKCEVEGCDVIYTQNHQACRCESIIAGRPCPEGTVPNHGGAQGVQ